MLNKVELLGKELSYIEDDCIRELTAKIINHIPDYFFDIPASSSGKYHAEFSLGPGGLLRHTKAACKIANDVLNLEWMQENFEKDAMLHKDYIIAALILHDACKSGYPEQGRYTKHEHPLLAEDLIRDVLESYESEAELDNDSLRYDMIRSYVLNVTRLISSHMGEWNVSNYSDIELPVPETFDQFLVHMFDFLASRKYINIDLK